MGATSEMYIKIQNEMMHTVAQAQNGNITHLDALIALEQHRPQLDISMAIIKEFKSDHFDDIAQEAAEHKEGYKGYVVETRNGGTSFDYKHIPEWQNAEHIKKQIEAKYKSMYAAKQNGNPHANISAEGEALPLPKIVHRKASIIVKPKR